MDTERKGVDKDPEQGSQGKREGGLPSQNSSSRFPKPTRYSAHLRKKSVWPFCRLWNTCGGDRRGNNVMLKKINPTSKIAVTEFSSRQDKDAQIRNIAVQSSVSTRLFS